MTTKIKITEQQFLEQVIDLAHLRGFRVAHFRPGMNRRGQWQTAVAGDGAGFPDLVLAKKGVVIFAELKADGGKVTPEQQRWLDDVGGYVWRPADFDRIDAILRLE